jgi:hypothetical protein
MNRLLAASVCAAAFLAGCNNEAATDAPADTAATMPAAPAASPPASPAAGWDRVALGLREQQLLSADLLGIDGVELGSIEGLLTGADGRVDRLLVEVEDSEPDRYVAVPVQGLTVLTRGSDIDVVSTMTAAQLAALPDASPPAATATPAPTAT